MGTVPLTFNSGSRTGVDKTLQQQSGNLAGQQKQAGAQRGSEYGTLMPDFLNLVNNGGYTADQKNAITQSTQGAIQSSYGSAKDAAKRRMARTGNSAGFDSFLGSAARGQAQDMASQNLANQKDFADQQLQQKLTGLQGIASLYGIDTSFLDSLNSGQNQLAGNAVSTYGVAKSKPGFLDSLSSSAGSGLGSLLTLH